MHDFEVAPVFFVSVVGLGGGSNACFFDQRVRDFPAAFCGGADQG